MRQKAIRTGALLLALALLAAALAPILAKGIHARDCAGDECPVCERIAALFGRSSLWALAAGAAFAWLFGRRGANGVALSPRAATMFSSPVAFRVRMND